MEKKIPFASDVILIDAAFLDRVGGDMAAHFAPLVGRKLPKDDLAVLLECLALDAGLEPGQHEIQVIFVYDAAHGRMRFCTPSDLEKEIHGMAFQGRLGEFSLYAFQTSGMARREDLFCESLQLLTESKDARRVMLVPDEGEYSSAVAELAEKMKDKEGVTVFGMNPPAHECSYRFEMLGFAVLQSLGIRAEEL